MASGREIGGGEKEAEVGMEVAPARRIGGGGMGRRRRGGDGGHVGGIGADVCFLVADRCLTAWHEWIRG